MGRMFGGFVVRVFVVGLFVVGLFVGVVKVGRGGLLVVGVVGAGAGVGVGLGGQDDLGLVIKKLLDALFLWKLLTRIIVIILLPTLITLPPLHLPLLLQLFYLPPLHLLYSLQLAHTLHQRLNCLLQLNNNRILMVNCTSHHLIII